MGELLGVHASHFFSVMLMVYLWNLAVYAVAIPTRSAASLACRGTTPWRYLMAGRTAAS